MDEIETHQKPVGMLLNDLLQKMRALRNPDLEVRLSIDGGKSSRPISAIAETDDGRLLLFFELDKWEKYFSLETKRLDPECPYYVYCGFKIPDVLQFFSKNPYPGWCIDLSVDNGRTIFPIQRIEQRGVRCLLIASPECLATNQSAS